MLFSGKQVALTAKGIIRQLNKVQQKAIFRYQYLPTAVCSIFLVGSASDPDPHGSALHLSPGSGSAFLIRIQQLIKLAPKAKIIHIIYSYLTNFNFFFLLKILEFKYKKAHFKSLYKYLYKYLFYFVKA